LWKKNGKLIDTSSFEATCINIAWRKHYNLFIAFYEGFSQYLIPNPGFEQNTKISECTSKMTSFQTLWK